MLGYCYFANCNVIKMPRSYSRVSQCQRFATFSYLRYRKGYCTCWRTANLIRSCSAHNRQTEYTISLSASNAVTSKYCKVCVMFSLSWPLLAPVILIVLHILNKELNQWTSRCIVQYKGLFEVIQMECDEGVHILLCRHTFYRSTLRLTLQLC